jgi:transcriptional regulator with XRE-family HTH domain
MKLGKNILYLCEKNNMTLKELAKRTSIPHSTLHGWAMGANVLKIEELKKICSIFEISLYQLLFGEDDPNGTSKSRGDGK